MPTNDDTVFRWKYFTMKWYNFFQKVIPKVPAYSKRRGFMAKCSNVNKFDWSSFSRDWVVGAKTLELMSSWDFVYPHESQKEPYHKKVNTEARLLAHIHWKCEKKLHPSIAFLRKAEVNFGCKELFQHSAPLNNVLLNPEFYCKSWLCSIASEKSD